jgi:hypothetical protein
MRVTTLFLLMLLTPLASSFLWAKGVYQEPEDFINEVFAGSPPEVEKITIKGDVKDQLKTILGHPYKKIRVPYWYANDRTVWILEKIGKELPITAGFVVKDNKIEQFRVLVFRESRGWEIRNEFFTEQFDGAYLESPTKLNQRIDNITGATLSVNAMKKLSKMALYLHDYVTTQQ